MRLYELIDFTPRITSKPSVRRADVVSKLNNYDFKGSGSFGSTYAVPSHKRLNQITKIGKVGYMDKEFTAKHASEPTQDGYLAYLNEIYKLEQDGNRNPYFPVIHDLKIFKDNNGKLSYNLNMERLHDFAKSSIISNTDLLRSLSENMFEWVPDDVLGFDSNYIIQTIKRAATTGRNENIADTQLQQALQLIHQIHVNTGRLIDLHSGNFMWRITGTMPQLVITDPLA